MVRKWSHFITKFTYKMIISHHQNVATYLLYKLCIWNFRLRFLEMGLNAGNSTSCFGRFFMEMDTFGHSENFRPKTLPTRNIAMARGARSCNWLKWTWCVLFSALVQDTNVRRQDTEMGPRATWRMYLRALLRLPCHQFGLCLMVCSSCKITKDFISVESLVVADRCMGNPGSWGRSERGGKLNSGISLTGTLNQVQLLLK